MDNPAIQRESAAMSCYAPLEKRMINFLKRFFGRNVIDVKKLTNTSGSFSLLEIEDDKDYFIIVDDRVVNIDDILRRKSVRQNQFTIVRTRRT